MKTFFILFGITFIMVLVAGGLINIAKTRKRKNAFKGGCHSSSGTSCSSCTSTASSCSSTPRKE